MTILNHVYAIKELITKGKLKNNFPFSNLFIQHFLEINRCLVLKQRMGSKEHLADINYTKVCIDLEITHFEQDCYKGQCKILKSKKPIPLHLANSLSVLTVAGESLSHRTLNQQKYSKYSITKSDQPFWFIFNNYIYIQNNLLIEKIILKGIFEDLESISLLDCNCTDGQCAEDYPFTVDPSYVPIIYDLTLKNLLMFTNEVDTVQEDNPKKNDKEQ